MIKTVLIAKVAAQGLPKTTDAIAPPNKWPLVPPATGKLIIWAANTKAVVKPMIGACRSPRLARVRFRATAITAALAMPVAMATGGERKPSGMCIDVSQTRELPAL